MKVANSAQEQAQLWKTIDVFSIIETEPQDRGLNLQTSKKKLTKSEYLKREKVVNIEDKSRKDLVRSFKDVFKNLKKKIANLHKTHGAEPEYIIIVKNNMQGSGGKNPSPTGGLYMVYGEGKMFKEFMRNGIKFDERFVLMANEYDMETKSNDIDQDQQS